MVNIDWVEIPSGKFIYGLSEELRDALRSKLPANNFELLNQELREDSANRYIWLDTFYISRFPVTRKQELEFGLSNHRFSYSNAFLPDKRASVLGELRVDLDLRGNHPGDTSWHFAMAKSITS